MNGFKIVRSDEAIETRTLIFTLFGSPGIGKTSLSFTMPQPVLFLDFDKGVQRASQKIRPDYIAVTDFSAFLNWLESDAFTDQIKSEGYKSVVVDTAGTLLDDYAAGHVKKVDYKNRNNSGGLTLAGWGAIKEVFNDKIRNRLQQAGLHICFICHDKDLGEDSPVKMGLSVSGGSSDIIERVSDQIGYMYAQGNKRVINFSAAQQLHKAKDTAGIGKVEIPDHNTTQYDNFLASIVEKCNTKMTEGSQAQIEAKRRIEEYREGIAECNEPKDFKAMMATIEEETGAVKAQVGVIFRERLEEVGLKYDGKQKQFVPVEPQEA